MGLEAIRFVRGSVKDLFLNTTDETHFRRVQQLFVLLSTQTAEGIDNHTEEDIEQHDEHDDEEGEVKDQTYTIRVGKVISKTTSVLKAVTASILQTIPQRIAVAVSIRLQEEELYKSRSKRKKKINI